MIVKNWMSKHPDTMSSDLSAKEAMHLFDKTRVPFMPVVDNGKFRGLIARRDLRVAAAWAIATQDIYEIQFFHYRNFHIFPALSPRNNLTRVWDGKLKILHKQLFQVKVAYQFPARQPACPA